jgi:hypothetical protein
MTMPPDKTNNPRQNMKTETTARRSRQFSWLASALLGLLIIQITGCASVPEGSDAMKQQALSFAPPSGKAGFYVIRPYEYTGSVLLDTISFDYQECGSLATDTYLFGTVLPGEHTLQANNPNGLGSVVVHFTAVTGKNYYFTVGVKSVLVLAGLAPTHYEMVINNISETDGQKFVRQSKLSGDNRFQFQNQPPPAQ